MTNTKTIHTETIGNVFIAMVYDGQYAIEVDNVQVFASADQMEAWNEYDRQVWQNAGEENV